jgi:hypothetical protein
MRTICVLCVAALLPCAARASGGDAFASRCEREMKPMLAVRAHEAQFDVFENLSSKVLNTRVNYARASQLTLGMTSGTTRTEILLDAPSLRDQTGQHECASPRIDVDLSYNPVQVYVAREFHKQSCAYRTVYEHEMRHVQLYRANLPVLEQRVREALQQRYGANPLYGAPGSALARLEDDVDHWLRPFIRAQLDEVEHQQTLLDTPEETFRLSHACLGEVEQAMGSSF